MEAGGICVISLLVCARGQLAREVDTACGPAHAGVRGQCRKLYWLASETPGNDTEHGAGHGTLAERSLCTEIGARLVEKLWALCGGFHVLPLYGYRQH